MPGGVIFSVSGIPELKRALRQKNFIIINATGKGILDGAFLLEEEVKNSIAGRRNEKRSVDTGRFMGSVYTTQSGPLEAAVKTNVSYAPFLEFGTSKIRPRRHFANSAGRMREAIVAGVKASISKALGGK